MKATVFDAFNHYKGKFPFVSCDFISERDINPEMEWSASWWVVCYRKDFDSFVPDMLSTIN
jgi:hypothetical protein